MEGAESKDSNEKKSSGLSQRPDVAPTVPSDGRGMEDWTLPSAPKTFNSEEALWVYWPTSFPPEAATASRWTSLSGTNSRQCSICGAARLAERTRHWGAFQLVRRNRRSPAKMGLKSDFRPLTAATTGPFSFTF